MRAETKTVSTQGQLPIDSRLLHVVSGDMTKVLRTFQVLYSLDHPRYARLSGAGGGTQLVRVIAFLHDKRLALNESAKSWIVAFTQEKPTSNVDNYLSRMVITDSYQMASVTDTDSSSFWSTYPSVTPFVLPFILIHDPNHKYLIEFFAFKVGGNGIEGYSHIQKKPFTVTHLLMPAYIFEKNPPVWPDVQVDSYFLGYFEGGEHRLLSSNLSREYNVLIDRTLPYVK